MFVINQQQELQQYIEDVLDTTALPVALGVFYVFRDPVEHQDFLSARSRRTIDWTQISARLGLGGPRTLWKQLYEEHRELLEAICDRDVERARAIIRKQIRSTMTIAMEFGKVESRSVPESEA